MLKYLHINNIAVIEKNDIELEGGLNILTGETGAGKSIVIDSINAILGQRTSKDIIRSGEDKAVVTAVFSDISAPAACSLESQGVFPDENGEYLVTRILSAAGKSSIKINGQPITSGVMRDIGDMLINIHGQHDNQALLNPATHCGYIDAVAKNSELLDDYYNEFNKLNSIRKQLLAADIDEDTAQRRKELLSFQIQEIENAALSVGELDKLKSKRDLLENSEKLIKTLTGVRNIVLGTDDYDGAATKISGASRDVLSLKSTEFDNISDKLTNISAQLESVGYDIEKQLDDLIFDVAEQDAINSRVELIRSVIRKYGGSEESALEHLKNASIELQNINNNDELIKQLEKQLIESEERLIKKAEKLTASRKSAAEAFCKKVCDVMVMLDMPNVKFSATIEKGKYTKTGCDECEFLISANMGEEMRPLSKIASGGELSRVMLAIKSVLSVNDPIDTLIFDEIDIGISGRAALKIATQLKKLASNKQIICVTHLAQIAAAADTHFLIEKSLNEAHTKTTVTKLNEQGRLGELSRIIGGRVTDANLQSAKELLRNFC